MSLTESATSMSTNTSKQLARTLAALASTPQAFAAPEGRSALTQALATRDAALLLQAANLVAEHQLAAHEDALRKAYRSLRPESRDALPAGAAATLAALVAALDALDSADADLFADAAQCAVLERGKGGPRDTAAAVRARGVLGLARTGHTDWLPIAGACLGDRDENVQLSAARAIAHRGQRDGAGLLLLRLGAGPAVPEVRSECLRGLFAIAPDLAERYARRALASARPDQPEQTEHILHALGTAPSDSAVELLEAELALRSLAEERGPVIAALGLSLRPSARALLLRLVTEDRSSDAQAALSALAIHRYDERLAEQLRELTSSSRELSRRVRELFGE
jgi:hypothetical protein